MVKYGEDRENTLFMAIMPWHWYHKRQVGGGHTFGVSSNLTGRHRIPTLANTQAESGKTSPLLRLNSIGEISSDSEQGVSDPNSMGLMSQDHSGNMDSAKYPYTHATDDQLHWLRYGNQFQQAYKMGFNPQTQMYMVPQQSYINPVWDTAPQVHTQQLGFGAQGFGSGATWSCYNAMQQHYPPQGLSLVYTVMGCGQPVAQYQEVAEAIPSWGDISNNQVPVHRVTKSRMNPNAKPFTPQCMRLQRGTESTDSDQPANAISDERREMHESNHEKATNVESDKKENGPVLQDHVEKSATVVSVKSDTVPCVITNDKNIEVCDNVNQQETRELTFNDDNSFNVDKLLTSASVGTPLLQSSTNDSSEKGPRKSCENDKEQSKGRETDVSIRSATVVSVVPGTSVTIRQENLGRNTYILSRPRLKKKSKPSLQDRKRRKKRTTLENGVNQTRVGKNDGEKQDGEASRRSFFLGSASSEEESEDDGAIAGNSLIISPLQCDSESGGESDWDEVDNIATAADFLTDQMCELLQPFMLSVLTVPDSACLSKSASAPHLTSHSLDAINRRWSEAYRVDSSSIDDIKSAGAKQKKQVHFAQEEGDNRPLQTVHPVEEYCRRGPWEQYAADRCRFKSRVAELQSVIDPVLSESHRNKVIASRFKNVS